MPTRAGRVARQVRVVETSVRLIRIEFTGYLPNREWTAYRGLPGRGVGPPRRGRQCLPRAGNRPRSSTPCQGRHTTGIPQGRPCRSGGGAQNRAFVLAHLLPPVMNMFPLPAWVAADDVLDGSGSRDPASSGRPPAELTPRGEPMAPPGLPLGRWIMAGGPPERGSLLLRFCDATMKRRVELQLRVTWPHRPNRDAQGQPPDASTQRRLTCNNSVQSRHAQRPPPCESRRC